MTLEGKTKDIAIALPSLIATQEFEPTAMMIKVLSVYLESIKNTKNNEGKSLTPPQILEKIGHNRRNWYNWTAKPLFAEWWSKACVEFFSKTGLYNVHSAIYRRAIDNSPQDAKMYLDRFDPNYKPATAQEHSFAGVIPPEDIAGAVERSKARGEAMQGLAKVDIDPKPVGEVMITSPQDSQQEVQQAAGGQQNEDRTISGGQGFKPVQGSTGQGQTPPGGGFEGSG